MQQSGIQKDMVKYQIICFLIVSNSDKKERMRNNESTDIEKGIGNYVK